MKKFFIVMLVLGFTSVAGCATFEGLGKDIQSLGKSIEDTSKEEAEKK